MQKKTRIFLASSEELKDDRVAVNTFISNQNKQLSDKGIFLHLEIWEDFIEAMSQTRLQDEYNKAIENSDIFLMLFFTKVGPYTLEEFEKAFGQFKKTNKPLIYTFFKTASVNMGELGEEVNTVFAFQKKLKELKHFQSTYKNTEHLLHQFDEQLKKLKVYEKRSRRIDSANKKKAIELTVIPKHDGEFIGRANDLKKLGKELEATQKIVLMSGLGGIGKTTLAKKYVQDNLHLYDHIAWIEVKSQETGHLQNMSIIEAFGYDEILSKSLHLDFTNENSDLRFKFIIQALSNLPGKNLLVVDNAREDINDPNIKNILPRPPYWNILVTSRNTFSGFKTLEIETLPAGKAKELFTAYYTKNDEEEEIGELLLEIGYHTLTIELLARTLSYPGQKLTIKETLQKIRSRQFSDPDLQRKIRSNHRSEEREIYLHLIQTFALSPLTEYEQWLMKQFYFLLPVPYTMEQLENFINIKTDDEKKELHEALYMLAEKGWLKLNEKNYSVHRIIQQMIYYQLEPGLKDIESLIERFTILLDFDTSTDFTRLFPLIPYAEFALAQLKKSELENSKVSKLQNNVGVVMRNLGEYEKARDLLEAALLSDLKNFGEQHPNVGASRSNLGILYKNLGEYEKARDLLEAVLSTRLKDYGEQDPNVAVSRSNLASVYEDLGDYEKARDLFEAALLSGLKNFGEQHPTVAVRRSNLANVYDDLGEYEKARDLLEAALSSDLKNFGEQHPNVAVRRSNLAKVYSNLSEYEKARDLLEAALSSDLKNFGEQHRTVAVRRSNLAIVYKDLEDYEKARNLLEAALSSLLKNFSEQHPDVAVSRSNLANVYKDLGDYEKAKDLLETALSSDLKNFGEQHPTIAIDFNNLAWVYVEMKHFKKAKNYFEKAIDILIKTVGLDHPNTKIATESLEHVKNKMKE